MDKDEMTFVKLRMRLNELLRRHIRLDDTDATDDQFVQVVYARWLQSKRAPTIDH